MLIQAFVENFKSAQKYLSELQKKIDLVENRFFVHFSLFSLLFVSFFQIKKSQADIKTISFEYTI